MLFRCRRQAVGELPPNFQHNFSDATRNIFVYLCAIHDATTSPILETHLAMNSFRFVSIWSLRGQWTFLLLAPHHPFISNVICNWQFIHIVILNANNSIFNWLNFRTFAVATAHTSNSYIRTQCGKGGNIFSSRKCTPMFCGVSVCVFIFLL